MSLSVTWCGRIKRESGASSTRLCSPVISTYSTQIARCVEQYASLLRKYPPPSPSTSTVACLPGGTRVLPDVHGAGSRSAPHHCRTRHASRSRRSREGCVEGRNVRSESSRTCARKTMMNPLELIEHLTSHGYGTPALVTAMPDLRTPRTLAIGLQAGMLPKDPSLREKIKGRARLEYELANMKADAFCEQQRQCYFRTASANLRNRDVRFQEEEMREQMLREHVSDDMDNTVSIVASPLDRDELFLRIEAWIEGVENAVERSPTTCALRK